MTLGKRKVGILLVVVIAVLGATFHDAIAGWAHPSTSDQMLTLSGDVEAHESELGFKTVQSRIVALPFDEGHWVKQGTLIAQVDDSDYAQQITIAEANLTVQQRQLDSSRQALAAARKTVVASQADLALRQADYRRNDALRKQDFVSVAYLDQVDATRKESAANLARDQALASASERNVTVAEAAVHDAQEAVKLARIVRGYCTLLAPFDGVITTRQAELGEIVVPGTPVITLADLDHVWLRAYVNETDLSRLRIGQAVNVTTDTYPGKHYHGRLSFIADKAEFTPKSVETHAERVSLVYRVKIDLENATHELVPGMPADATIDLRGQGKP